MSNFTKPWSWAVSCMGNSSYRFMHSRSSSGRLSALFFIIISFAACKNEPKSNVEKSAEVYAANIPLDNCLASASWFTKVDGVRKTPAPLEGATSAFANNSTVTNCDFHQWSWQKFLWLTNETHEVPFFLSGLEHVNANGKPVSMANGLQLTAIAQASSSKDVLRTNKNFGPGKVTDTVYYAIHINKTLRDAMEKYGPIAKDNPALVEKITFPVGALEIKTSWVNVNAIEDTSTYFVTDGEIHGQKTKVALLGMHVVGVVENHPEFVWATFEHEDLAPHYDWEKATPTKDAPVTSDKDYLLFEKGATATIKNISSENGNYTNVFSVYKYGVPVHKEMKGNHNVQLYMETSQNGSQNYNNIRVLNESVKKQLGGVWNHYYYDGSIWIDTEGYEGTEAQAAVLDSLSYHLSNSKKGDLTRGSVVVANLTMETYVQVGFSAKSIHGEKVENLVNCFSCHNASGNGNNLSPLYLSHLFNGYVKDLQGLSSEAIKAAHVAEIKGHFALKAAQIQ